MSWEIVWKVVFVALLIAFAGMSVLVTIFGASDIRKLLLALREESDQRPSETDDGSGS